MEDRCRFSPACWLPSPSASVPVSDMPHCQDDKKAVHLSGGRFVFAVYFRERIYIIARGRLKIKGLPEGHPVVNLLCWTYLVPFASLFVSDKAPLLVVQDHIT
jgi:hypothetical protein